MSSNQYREFALPYISMICNAINDVPVTVFAKGAYGVLSDLRLLNCQTIGLDWNMNPNESRMSVGDSKTLTGQFGSMCFIC